MPAAQALPIALATLVVGGPLALFAALAWRSARLRGHRLALLGTTLLGAVAFVPAALVQRWLEGATGLDPRAGATGDVAALVYAFLVVAPIEQGLEVAAVMPVRFARRLHGTFEGIVYAAAAALGLIAARDAALLWSSGAEPVTVARALLAIPAHLFFASMWGYALGREPSHRVGGRLFNSTWMAATLFHGLYDHIVFRRSTAALIGAVPILLTLGFFAFLSRDLVLGDRRKRPVSAGRRFLRALAPPSLHTMREALRRTERPVALGWIAFGALVTVGVMTAALAGAVALGHSIGVDFAAVDAQASTSGSTAPLVLLGAAALGAFPVAGYLVARASSVRTVLEPAMAAGLSIAGALVLLGLAAPVAVVFALAFAPIAFGLACAGAWVGLGR